VAAPAAGAFDAQRGWRLHPQVALRDESFGALAYHYGNRRLSFVRSTALVEVLRCLERHTSAAAAVDSVVAVPDRERHLRALAALVRSEMVVPG
jgi:putative mycofactocin binding protein MftB